MADFFLYNYKNKIDLESLESVFIRKGLSHPLKIRFGVWMLLLYPKMLVDEPNIIYGALDQFAFCIGTISYHSQCSRKSLSLLNNDYYAGCIDKDELIGNYCVGFWDGRLLTLMTDQLNLQHVFVNTSATCLSSSFLALLASSSFPLRLNRMAVHEKLASGYIVAPDTLVEGIIQLNYELASWLEENSSIKLINKNPYFSLHSSKNQRFEDSVDVCCEVLKSYFNKIQPIASEYRAELGLSNGYDSRLLLALSGSFPFSIPLHSHHTIKVHEYELDIAQKLASIGGNVCRVIPTKRLEDQDEDTRRKIIMDNLYFFDGRCIHDMGHFSETYTAGYRKMVLGDNRLSLNGLGGESYRNVYTTPIGRFDWNDWQDYSVFFPFAIQASENIDSFLSMRAHRNAKIEKRIGCDLSATVDYYTIRQYYSLVRMPDCAGNVCNAFNQVAYMLTPFIEPLTVREVLSVSSSNIGVDGKFEAALIQKLSPKLAAVSSQYGHSFSVVPNRYLVKAHIKAAIPLRMRTERKRKSLALVLQNQVGSADYPKVVANSCFINELAQVLRDTFPTSDWVLSMCNENQMRTSLYIASFINEFRHKLIL